MGIGIVKSGWFWFAVVAVALITANIIWIALDASPPLWDMAGHSSRAAQTAELLRGFHVKSVLTTPGAYPPATYVVTAKAFILFGMKADVPQYSLLFFLTLYCLSMYGIGLRVFQRSAPAFAAMLLSLFYPLLAHFTRIYDLDFPLTAWTVGSIAVLLASERFSKRGWSIMFGICVGIGMLTKWTLVFFVLGPLLVVFWKQWIDKNALRNFLFALMIAAILAGPWYLVHVSDIARSAEATRQNVFSVPAENLFSWESIGFYSVKTIKSITWPLALFAVAGIVYALRKRSAEHRMLLLWIFVPYVILTFAFLSKESRYYLPAFPALALLSVAALQGLRHVWRRALSVLVLLLGFWVWLETSWNLRVFPHEFYFRMKFYNNLYGYFEPSTEKVGFGFPYPTQYQTNVPDIAQAIRDDAQHNGKRDEDVRVAVAPNSIFLTAQQIQYYGLLLDFRPDYGLSSRIRRTEEQHRLIEADYVVTKTGEQGPSVWRGDLDDLDPKLLENFTLLQTWPLDGIEGAIQEARLYRRK